LKVKYSIEERKMEMKKITSRGENLLHFLCAHTTTQKLEILKYLMEKGIGEEEINGKNEEGEDCFFLATRIENLEILRFLIEQKNYDPLQINLFGNSPLHVACLSNENHQIIRYLIEKRCDLNLKNS
jgi:ankyrin repeat protein